MSTAFTWHCQWQSCSKNPWKVGLCHDHFIKASDDAVKMAKYNRDARELSPIIKIQREGLERLLELSDGAMRRYLSLRKKWRTGRHFWTPYDGEIRELNEAGMLWVGTKPGQLDRRVVVRLWPTPKVIS